MQDFKLDIYKEKKGTVFSGIESLGVLRIKEIAEEIFNLIGLSALKKERFFPSIENKLAYKDFEDTYSIRSIFQELKFEDSGDLLILWDENSIDRVDTNALLDNWEYIWYDVSDDAVILYHQESKNLLLITHYGRIFYFIN